MTVNVHFFALARDLAGNDTLSIDLPEDATVADLRTALADQVPKLKPILPQLFIALGENCVDDLTPLYSGASVACFPPVSGG
ncbi:MAG TPA: MoaD/ThiS family protein [Planctomicrobium sp.]|nr:MoaD/ThiS family protein [Planctomicrobium sp.]